MIFYPDQSKRKHNLIPIEYSKNESKRLVDLLIYRTLHALIEKIHVFSGDHHKNFSCRRCLISYTSEKMLMIQKPNCGNKEITTIRTSSQSHLHWRKLFQTNPFF